MSLRKYVNEGRLERHKCNTKEIEALLAIAKRDIHDASIPGLSYDRCFATAYNAVLQCATVIVRASGYRSKGVGHHYTIFLVAAYILGDDYADLFDYFDACRSKRNITDYTHAGGISKKESQELIEEAGDFIEQVKKWLKNNVSD